MQTQTIISADKDLFKQLFIDTMEAWKSRDEKTIDNFLHEEFCFVNDMIRDYCMDKPAWMKFLLEKFELLDYHVGFQKIKIRNKGQMASVISRVHMRMKPGYNDEPAAFLITDIWVNNDGEWKLMLRQRISSSLIR